MMFIVHLFPVVRVKITGVEASTMEEAIDKAEARVQLHRMFDGMAGTPYETEWAEEFSHYLVDVFNDNDYSRSKWFGPGKEEGWPDLVQLIREVLDADGKDLPRFMGINPTVDRIITLRMQKESSKKEDVNAESQG